MVRDPEVTPGGETREATSELITWRVSAHGVTEDGARAFEYAANQMYDLWDPVANRLGGCTSRDYQIVALPEDEPVRIILEDGALTVLFNCRDFCRASVNAFRVELREHLRLVELVA